MKKVKTEKTERIDLPNKKCFKNLSKKKYYKYLGSLEVDSITQR